MLSVNIIAHISYYVNTDFSDFRCCLFGIVFLYFMLYNIKAHNRLYKGNGRCRRREGLCGAVFGGEYGENKEKTYKKLVEILQKQLILKFNNVKIEVNRRIDI